MPDQKMDVTNRRNYEFTKHDFGDAIYVAVDQENFNVYMIGTGHDPEVRRSGVIKKSWGVCVNRETYFKHGGLADPNWVLFAEEHEEYIALTQDYFDAYQKDQHWDRRFDKEGTMKQDLFKALEAGLFHLIVRRNESVMFDLKNQPIPRWFRMDYISGNIRGGKYYMGKVTDFLKKHPRCHEVEREKIPYYNAEFEGESAVEFFYEPAGPEFQDLIDTADSFERMDKIRKALGLEQFERKTKKRDRGED